MKTKKQNSEKNTKKLDFYSFTFVAVAVIVIGYLLITKVFFKPEPLVVKSKEQQIENVKEPQFVKQGELEFISKKDNKVIKKIDIEIADSELKTQQGLMYRKSMEENRGMLFIFPTAEVRSFWMKNTIIPLDIIFVNEKKEIIKIHKNTVPYSVKSLESIKPALYTVEVNAGFTEKYGIKEGDLINFKRL